MAANEQRSLADLLDEPLKSEKEASPIDTTGGAIWYEKHLEFAAGSVPLARSGNIAESHFRRSTP